jgi:mono/diheme cytochrome c family protein
MKRLACLVLIVGAVLTGCREASSSPSALYSRNCGACHGTDLSGAVGPALGAGSEAAAASDEDYRNHVRAGSDDMPSFRSLSDERLDAIISYLREIQAR